jgi:hypothetical protein
MPWISYYVLNAPVYKGDVKHLRILLLFRML